MPIYEYVCEECKNKFETLVKSSESDKEQECPKCGSKRVKKAFSAFACRGSKGGHPSGNPCGG